jgi:peptidoglycan/LPS O-acetylase OafA/YrhL
MDESCGAIERALTSSGSNGSVMPRRVPALDTLRAFAMTWVVVAHIGSSWHLRTLPPVLRCVFDAGLMGADLVCVLSGLLIGGIVLRELEETSTLDVLRYWVPRWVRTLPAYTVTLALVAFASRGRWLDPWAHVVFAPNDPPFGSRFAWVWSLCIEGHFGLVFPLAVLAARAASPRLTPRAALRAVALVAVVASLVSRELVVHPLDVFAHGSTLHRTIDGPADCLVSGRSAADARLDGLAVGVLLASMPPMNLTRAWVAAMIAASAALVAACVVSPRHPLHESLVLAVAFGLLALAMTHDRAARAVRLTSWRGTAAMPCGLQLCASGGRKRHALRGH